MAEPFLSEIRIMSFGFVPRGWALCNGQLLPINQNQALFALLSTTFGGDGRTNFALPDLRGRAPIHLGQGHALGERGGEQTHTLSIAELPTHAHVAQATSAAGDVTEPTGNLLAAVDHTTFGRAYGGASPAALSPEAVSDAGGGQAHPNMQPFVTLSFCIALQGIFPSQS
jgi:microcystin-dependent protein